MAKIASVQAFNKEDLIDCLSDDSDVLAKIRDELVETTRWSVLRELTFGTMDGKVYQTTYSVGATEMQDEGPFEYDGDLIHCIEVEPVEVTVIEYRPVYKTTGHIRPPIQEESE